MAALNVFVLALDDKNLATLQDVAHADDYRFHQLLGRDEMQYGKVSLDELLEAAERQLAAFPGRVDAIVGYLDFPVSTMVPILCDRHGLRSASLRAVVACEHKYWSRLEQQKVIDEHPRFAVFDPDGPARLPAGVEYPVWVKPVKSYSSHLAYKVRDDEEFAAAAAEVREGIDRLADPFEEILRRVELPPEVAEAGARSCVLEESMSGSQATVEGYVQDGRIRVYGIVDSLTYPDSSSFLRYQYPSALPDDVQSRLAELSERVIKQIGLDNSTFCIEYFHDAATGRIGLLEVNPRHSQSHAELFELVDGIPNHHCMLSVALGRDPRLPHRQGPYQVAATWHLRRFRDGVVRHRAPDEAVERLAEEIPGVRVIPKVKEGMRLSEAPQAQDSYSYELANVYVGADDEAGLREKYERCVAALDFRFDDGDSDGDAHADGNAGGNADRNAVRNADGGRTEPITKEA